MSGATARRVRAGRPGRVSEKGLSKLLGGDCGGGSGGGGGQTLPLRAARPLCAPPGSHEPGSGSGPAVSSRAGARTGSDVGSGPRGRAVDRSWQSLGSGSEVVRTASSAAVARAGARVPIPDIVGGGVGTASFAERRVLPHPGVPVPWSGVAGDYAAARVVLLLSRHAAAPHPKAAFSPQCQVRGEQHRRVGRRARGWPLKSASARHRPREKPGPRHGRGSSLSFLRTLRYSLSPPRCPRADWMMPAHPEEGSSSLSSLTHLLIYSGNTLTGRFRSIPQSSKVDT
ncbi:uncharacterized protein LOC141580450 [Saimiri boliviensis]|uniref:uncharacterized protein LOC141580450 n=1 Tax=Saimiri boliviensis TaxID=27679 RepID=UPI003D772FD9